MRIDRLIAGSHPELTTHSAVLPGWLSSRRLQQLFLAVLAVRWLELFHGGVFCGCDPKHRVHTQSLPFGRGLTTYLVRIFSPPKFIVRELCES